MNDVESFLTHHDACPDGLRWAVDNCGTMDEVWETAKPEWLVWVATRDGVLDKKTLVLFSCFSARQHWDLLTDERSRVGVETAERWVIGEATDEQMASAASESRAERAAWAAWEAWAASEARVASAAWAAWAASAACEARAAREAWSERAERVAWEASEARADEQSKWLRNNAKPNFDGGAK